MCGNNPVSRTDPSGLRTYFIPGIGGSLYPGFTNALQGPPTYLTDVRTFPVFQAGLPGTLKTELEAAAEAAADPTKDPDAQALARQVKSDLLRDPLAAGEQLNFIGYSGGATVAFDAAVILQYATGMNFASRIVIDNIVTLGGFVFRGKPGNVAKWTEVTGDLDVITRAYAFPDALYWEYGVAHFPIGPIPSYVTGGGIPQTLNIVNATGLR